MYKQVLPYKDPEKAKENARQYYLRNKERFQQYKQENKEQTNNARKDWYSRNRDKMLEYDRKWREEHKEHVHQRTKEYNEKNKEKLKQQYDERNVRNRPNQLEFAKRYIRFKDKRILLDKNPRTGICLICGKKGVTDIHHTSYENEKDPLANTLELCRACHFKWHQKFGVPKGYINPNHKYIKEGIN